METKEHRSKVMRAVKSQNTGLEWVVRRIAYGIGYRYRLHRHDLPGKPDLAFPARRKVIFVNGCFWHQHDCARGARTPKAHAEYWIPKLRRTKQRDAANWALLRRLGWGVLVVWECETKDHEALARRIRMFMEGWDGGGN